jgi:DNA-binding NtrC family response regulator
MTDKRPILVVDDEPDMLDSLRSLLRHDFQVYTASSGAEGAAILEKHEIHVVMTDQRMPQMTGVAFLTKIKNEHPEAIRLIFTGYADISAVIDAINQGNVFRYVCKPWDPEQLIATLQEAGEQYDLILERRGLLEDLKKNEEQWMAFEAHLRAQESHALSPEAAEQQEKLHRASRELLGRLGAMLALPRRGIHA